MYSFNVAFLRCYRTLTSVGLRNFLQKFKNQLKFLWQMIIYADSDHITRGNVSEFLSKNNYEVKVAGNGEQALELILNNKVDLLITAIEMPIMDGYTLIKSLIEHGYNFPIIVKGDYNPDGVKYELIYYLLRPNETSELLKVVNRLMKNEKPES